MFKRLLQISVIVFLGVTVFHPQRHAKHYSFIPKSDTLYELIENTYDRYSNLKPCTYNDVLTESKEVWISDIFKKCEYNSPRKGI